MDFSTIPHTHESIFTNQNVGKIVCATSLIISETSKKIILILHNKTQKINFPGGKLDGTNDTVYKAMRREIQEEVGIGSKQLHAHDCISKKNGNIIIRPSRGRQTVMQNHSSDGKIVDYVGVFMVEDDLPLQFLLEIKKGGWESFDEKNLTQVANKYFPQKPMEECFFPENLELLRRLKI